MTDQNPMSDLHTDDARPSLALVAGGVDEPSVAQRAIEDEAAPTAARRPVWRLAVPLSLAALALAGVGASAVTQRGSDGLGAQPAAAVTPTATRSVSAVSRDLSRPAIASSSPAASSTLGYSAVGRPVLMTLSSKPAPVKKAETSKPTFPTALGAVIGTRYPTVLLNARSAPSADSALVSILGEGSSVKVTGTVVSGFRQVSHQGKPAWVKDSYLSTKKPVAVTESKTSSSKTSTSKTSSTKSSTNKTSTSKTTTSSTSSSISSSACASGSGVESGLVPNGDLVHRAVCNKWPSITGYGGYRAGGGEHSTGQALDIMVSGSLGWEVANWLRANASRFGITEVIYSQKIWTTQRAGEGWRSMSDRGSATANHYDHVHVTVR